MRSILSAIAVAVISITGSALHAQTLQECPSAICTESTTTLDLDLIPGQVVAYETVTVDYSTASYYTICGDVEVARVDATQPSGWVSVSPFYGGFCSGLGQAFGSASNTTTIPAYPGIYFADSLAWLNVDYTAIYYNPVCSLYCSEWEDPFGYSYVSISNPGPGTSVPWTYTYPGLIELAYLFLQRINTNGSSGIIPVPMPNIVLKSDDAALPTNGSCKVLIDGIPQMPELIASLSPQPPLANSLRVTWHTQLSWTQSTGSLGGPANCTNNIPSTVPYTDIPLVPTPYTQSAYQSYCLTPSQGCALQNAIPFSEVRGGNAKVWVDYGGVTSSPVTCQILGDSKPIDEATVKSTITSAPWYYSMMIRWESQYKQFHSDNKPYLGVPCGFGIAQDDPPGDPSIVWNWRANVPLGISVANTAFSKAKAQWSTYKDNYARDAAINPGAEQPPCGAFIGSPPYCFFQYPDPTSPINSGGFTTASWGDANGIRRYNSGPNSNRSDFLIYVPIAGGNRGYWQFNSPLTVCTKCYVPNVCSQKP